MPQTGTSPFFAAAQEPRPRVPTVAIVGSPNVGKSVLFGALCGTYVTVSNYPGTTVEVSRGAARLEGREYEIIDTPGLYSLNPISEEERVARDILLAERVALVLHVVDAKNLERMLPLTLQLAEARLPSVLVLNMMDEAAKEGVAIDVKALERELGMPVVGTVSTTGRGLAELRAVMTSPDRARFTSQLTIRYPVRVERLMERLAAESANEAERLGVSARFAALLLVRNDEEAARTLGGGQSPDMVRARRIIDEAGVVSGMPPEYDIALALKDAAHRIASKAVTFAKVHERFRDRLSRAMMHPLTGFPILFVILYLGLYKFVGSFGAGTVVDFIEGTIFEKYLNPWLSQAFAHAVPFQAVRDLFVGEYGVLTLGLRYAVALILPIVTFFFLVFAVIEDSGYLPRLAMLIDRMFKKIGLSGRAVIPMVLGLGCDTMATMVTRTLPTKRERLISTLLLALAVPCSAQLGVILALLEGRPGAAAVWAGVVIAVLLLVGLLTARLLPGDPPIFYMEIPPLRVPKLGNVLSKTYARVKWYFKEIMPLFLGASALIWLGQLTRAFDAVTYLLSFPVRWIGLPPESARVFLFGFFRRDYGAAGLYDLQKLGLLSGTQLVVACVALTLFLPCIAQLLMNVKERGWKTGLGISAFTLFFSFGVAYVLNVVLTALGVTL
jgi:ferrous iron transport protein B